ncbi:hypothetical protein Tco_0303804 [Tanacetum coccineum]
MELENSQNNSLAKLPILKLGEYEMWEIRIKQYFQIQDYALWEVIENGNSWVPIPVTAPESGPSTALKMTVPSTTEEKICKKNDVKARSLLLMALPNEHQLTFNQYADAQSMFIAIKARFGGNDATKKTQKALLKQQYENFNATSSESLDSIFNRLQKLVSRLAILGVDTPAEDLNVKFLRSLPSEWDTHVVVWMNKPDFETMGLDDLYNNFKIVEQKVKRTVAVNNDDKNLAFLTTSSSSSTNPINTVNTGVSTGTTKVNTAGTETSTASFSDATVYAFLSTQPQGSQLVHEDLEQIHDDDLEEMDLKWNMALLSMRARKFYQRTGRKIVIDGSSTAGYDKSKMVLDLIGSDMAEMKIQATWLSWNSRFSCPNVHKHMVPRAVLMKTGLKTVNNARPVNTVRSVNTARTFSTARDFNTVRPSYTAHPKLIVHCARPRTHFQNQAQSTVQRPFYKKTALTKRSYFHSLNDKGYVDSGCSLALCLTGCCDIKELWFLFTVLNVLSYLLLLFTDGNLDIHKILGQDNMYSFDMKIIVPKDGLTCLVAKGYNEESDALA